MSKMVRIRDPDCEFMVRPTGDFKMLGTQISVSKDKVYQAMHASNIPNWERRGLIFILDAEGDAPVEFEHSGIGFLLPKEDYVVIP